MILEVRKGITLNYCLAWRDQPPGVLPVILEYTSPAYEKKPKISDFRPT